MMGMSYAELLEMDLADFLVAYQGWQHLEEQRQRMMLETMRWGAAAVILPWLDKAQSAKDIMPLPWDNNTPDTCDVDDLELRRERAYKLLNNEKHE
jgi:hypothetical protein